MRRIAEDPGILGCLHFIFVMVLLTILGGLFVEACGGLLDPRYEADDSEYRADA